MSWVINKFNYDVIVLVATSQSAKSEQQFQLADEKDNDIQFSGSIGTKEEKRRRKLRELP